MEDTSLEDFVSTVSGSEAESEGDEDHPSGEGEGAMTGVTAEPEANTAAGTAGSGAEDDDPERPAVTARWSADAEPCADCGEPSAWRWAEGGSMVCPACKDWECGPS